jgi:hypothetical protein
VTPPLFSRDGEGGSGSLILIDEALEFHVDEAREASHAHESAERARDLEIEELNPPEQEETPEIEDTQATTASAPSPLSEVSPHHLPVGVPSHHTGDPGLNPPPPTIPPEKKPEQ